MSAIVFDTEATGIKDAVIIEAAWMRVHDISSLFHIDASFCQRYNPGKPIEPGAMAVHHILDEEVADMPDAATFAIPVDTEYLVGHNIDFDWNLAGAPDVKRICTLALARSIWPDVSHQLGALLYYLTDDRSGMREKLRHAHSALADVELCLILLSHIVPHLGVSTWEELWIRSEAARVPTVMPFGKYKGEFIAAIPPDYKRWLLGQPDVDPYLIKALKGSAV